MGGVVVGTAARSVSYGSGAVGAAAWVKLSTEAPAAAAWLAPSTTVAGAWVTLSQQQQHGLCCP